MYIYIYVLGVSIWSCLYDFLLELWNCFSTVVLFVLHFITLRLAFRLILKQNNDPEKRMGLDKIIILLIQRL